MSLAIGNVAPGFRLRNHKGEWVCLEDFKGKKHVVLYFYPKALTPGCTVQACGLRDVKQVLESKDIVVFGVSPDPVEKLQRFVDKHALNFDLLSDEDCTLTKSYGVWQLKKFMGREFMGVVRSTFVIDKSGVLAGQLGKFKTSNHDSVLLEHLEALL